MLPLSPDEGGTVMKSKTRIELESITHICPKLGRKVSATVAHYFVETDGGQTVLASSYAKTCEGQYECGVVQKITAADGLPSWSFDFSACPLGTNLGRKRR
jgi:hypothetical protein